MYTLIINPHFFLVSVFKYFILLNSCNIWHYLPIGRDVRHARNVLRNSLNPILVISAAYTDIQVNILNNFSSLDYRCRTLIVCIYFYLVILDNVQRSANERVSKSHYSTISSHRHYTKNFSKIPSNFFWLKIFFPSLHEWKHSLYCLLYITGK